MNLVVLQKEKKKSIVVPDASWRHHLEAWSEWWCQVADYYFPTLDKEKTIGLPKSTFQCNTNYSILNTRSVVQEGVRGHVDIQSRTSLLLKASPTLLPPCMICENSHKCIENIEYSIVQPFFFWNVFWKNKKINNKKNLYPSSWDNTSSIHP
jgi:hypothetical protein